jgi:hypothetical protein
LHRVESEDVRHIRTIDKTTSRRRHSKMPDRPGGCWCNRLWTFQSACWGGAFEGERLRTIELATRPASTPAARRAPVSFIERTLASAHSGASILPRLRSHVEHTEATSWRVEGNETYRLGSIDANLG